jgi:hypothetical protein
VVTIVMSSCIDYGLICRLRAAVDSLRMSTNVRVGYGERIADVEGRNKAYLSRRKVHYRLWPKSQALPAIAWNQNKAIAFPRPGDTLPKPPNPWGQRHEWRRFQVPRGFVEPVIGLFGEWLGAIPDFLDAPLVEVALLDPVVAAWKEDGKPVFERADTWVPRGAGWWELCQEYELESTPYWASSCPED